MYTKLPWRLAQYRKGIEPPIDWATQKTIVIFAEGKEDHGDVAYLCHSLWGDEKAKENADFILRAVNSHADLVAALEKIVEMNVRYCIDKYGDASKADSMGCVTVARKALAKEKS